MAPSVQMNLSMERQITMNSHDVSGMVIWDLGIGTGASGTTICVNNTLICHIAKEISDFRRRKIGLK